MEGESCLATPATATCLLPRRYRIGGKGLKRDLSRTNIQIYRVLRKSITVIIDTIPSHFNFVMTFMPLNKNDPESILPLRAAPFLYLLVTHCFPQLQYYL